jgi:outer membrane immunogenic protein
MTFKIASLAAGAAILAFAPAAFAADMPVAQQPMDAVVQEAGFDWTGFYVGVYGGYGWGDVDVDDGFAESDTEGGLAGGTVGYNMQSGNFVYGLEADGGWAGIETQDFADDENVNLDWTSTVRGRVGYAFDNFLVYATGGAAIGGVEDELSGDDDTRLGWTAGAGVEASLTEHISAKVEYLYLDLGDDDLGGVPVDIQVHTVKGGINYRF